MTIFFFTIDYIGIKNYTKRSCINAANKLMADNSSKDRNCSHLTDIIV